MAKKRGRESVLRKQNEPCEEMGRIDWEGPSFEI